MVKALFGLDGADNEEQVSQERTEMRRANLRKSPFETIREPFRTVNKKKSLAFCVQTEQITRQRSESLRQALLEAVGVGIDPGRPRGPAAL